MDNQKNLARFVGELRDLRLSLCHVSAPVDLAGTKSPRPEVIGHGRGDGIIQFRQRDESISSLKTRALLAWLEVLGVLAAGLGVHT